MAVFLEFLKSLLENNIPQQPSQQAMLIKFIIKTQDYTTLHSLLQYHVLTDSLELARILTALGSTESKLSRRTFYYRPAFQLGLDMLQRLRIFDEIVVALINEGVVMKALDFALEKGVHSMKLSSFLEAMEMLKEEGESSKADLILKRVTEIRKFDEAKLKNEKGYQPLLVEE